MIIKVPFKAETRMTASGVELYEYSSANIDMMAKESIKNIEGIIPPEWAKKLIEDDALRNDIICFYQTANIEEVNAYIDKKIRYILSFLNHADEMAVLADIDIGRPLGFKRYVYSMTENTSSTIAGKSLYNNKDIKDIMHIVDNLERLVRFKFRFITFPHGVKNEVLMQLLNRLQQGAIMGIPIEKFTDSIILGPTDDPLEFDKTASAIFSCF